ncbi:MAG: DUF3240 family protein [Xanthomonadales bacterium]|jgi:hypothetical protein|nr:DUF3240 family protein [Xanthomonadales bacterium]
MTEFLLRLNIPPGLEEDVVDLLLSSDEIAGYQSYPIRGHGRVGAMSVAEQVAGRRDRIQFEIVLDENVLESTLERLKDAFPISDVIYWVLPVLRSGRLSGENS